MSNNHYYTPIELQDLYLHFISKLDFSIEDLTTDKDCTIKFYPDSENEPGKKQDIQYELCEKYERDFIGKTLLNIKQDGFESHFNSHDWIKIYKHVFQHTELINTQNIGAIKAWHFFSLYFREAFNNPLITPEDYNLQLKHFIAILIFNGCELEAKCIHQFLQLASKIQSNNFTVIDSQKVANMLGGVFYTALKIEGRNAPFKLLDLQDVQQFLYIQNLKKMSGVLKFIIEDAFYEQNFNKNIYTEFLIIGKRIENMPELSPRNEDMVNDERLPDESFIQKFKLKCSTDEQGDNQLPLNQMANLKISRKRVVSPERVIQEDASVKVSFSDDALMKRTRRINEEDEIKLSPDKKEKSNLDLRRKYMAASRSLGDKLEKKCKDDFETIQHYNIFSHSDGERRDKLERKASKKNLSSSASAILDEERKNMFSSKETSPRLEGETRKESLHKERSLSPVHERRKIRIRHESSSSPETEKRKLFTSKERSLSPDPERRLFRSKNEISSSPDSGKRTSSIPKSRSLSPDIERRQLHLSQETGSGPEAQTRKKFLSKGHNLSPEIERRCLNISQETTPNLENERRQELIFSLGAGSAGASTEINQRIVLEEKDKTQVDKLLFK